MYLDHTLIPLVHEKSVEILAELERITRRFLGADFHFEA
jgi:hypothetical protein